MQISKTEFPKSALLLFRDLQIQKYAKFENAWWGNQILKKKLGPHGGVSAKREEKERKRARKRGPGSSPSALKESPGSPQREKIEGKGRKRRPKQ